MGSEARLEQLKGAALAPAIALYNLLLFAVLERPAYLPNDGFPFVADLEENWKAVRAELDWLIEHGPAIPPFVAVDPQQKKLWTTFARLVSRLPNQVEFTAADQERWRTFVFRTYGRDVPPNRELCPTTAQLLDRVPGLVGAMFSVLEPNVELPYHFGLFPGALRIHLGLAIPNDDKTGIRVGGKTRHWAEGEAFVFEHTRFHTAWNRSGEPRVILILDVERPMPWRWLGRLNHRLVASLRTWNRTRDAVAHIEGLTASAANGVSPS